MRWSPCVAVLVVLVVLAAAPLARADEAGARAAYARGEALARKGRFPEAARAFAEADELAPNDTALESALEGAIRADDPVLGMRLVDRAERSPSAKALRATGKATAKFASRAALIVIPCVGEQPACEAAVDGAPATSARTWVAAGAHKVALQRGGRDLNRALTLAGGAREEVAFPAEDAPTPPPVVAPPPPPAETSGISRGWFFVAVGVTAALGGVTIAHGVAALGKHNDFAAENGKASRSELQGLASDGQSLDARTNVFLAATCVAAAGTAALGIFAVRWSSPSAPAEAAVVPLPGGAGLVAVGRF